MKKKGQIVVEYLVFLIAIVIVLIIFLGKNGYFRTAFESTLNGTKDQVNSLRNEIKFQGREW